MTLITFDSYSMRRNEGTTTYDWCVFVAGPADIVRSIECVEYTLHSSFKDPKRLIDTPENRFCLVSSGWGGFRVQIETRLRSGATQSSDYLLTLREDSWPRPTTPPLPSGTPEQRMVKLLEDAQKYRWRRVGTLARAAEQTEPEAVQTLKRLADRGICREVGFDALDGQPMWGACSVIGELPRL